MQIVTDTGAQPFLAPERMDALGIHVIPLNVTLEGHTYHEGVDIDGPAFYELLAKTDALPTTSQPSPGEFAALYRELAASDPEILSIHISSGLSGTLNAAQAGAKQVPEARITHVDTHTLSAGAGWQVEAAARARNAGWPLDRVLGLIERISAATDSLYTLAELRYLIHGGRISHMKGLIASLLNLKPMIGVEKAGGTYQQRGQVRSFAKALCGLVDLVAQQHAPGSPLRVQVLHAANPEGAEELQELMDKRFACTWLPIGPISMVLGAHTGPTMIGVAFGPANAYAEMP